MVEMDTMEMDGDNGELPLDENSLDTFLAFLPSYLLCNTTNYTKLPLCNNDTKVVVEVSCLLRVLLPFDVCVSELHLPQCSGTK